MRSWKTPITGWYGGGLISSAACAANLVDNRYHLIITGPIACPGNERAFLHVTVTQRATGAVAEGRTRLLCTGETQHWEVHASIHGKATFQEGPATAVAVGHTLLRGEATDAHQWLVDVTLGRE